MAAARLTTLIAAVALGAEASRIQPSAILHRLSQSRGGNRGGGVQAVDASGKSSPSAGDRSSFPVHDDEAPHTETSKSYMKTHRHRRLAAKGIHLPTGGNASQYAQNSSDGDTQNNVEASTYSLAQETSVESNSEMNTHLMQGRLADLMSLLEAKSNEFVSLSPDTRLKPTLQVCFVVAIIILICCCGVVCSSCMKMNSKSKRKKDKHDKNTHGESPFAHDEDGGERIQHVHDGRVIYEWEQSPGMVTIYIRPPGNMKRSELDIKIRPKLLTVGRKGKPPFLREEIYAAVDEDSSSWRLRSNAELEIYLIKVQKGEWPFVLHHHREHSSSTPEPHGSPNSSLIVPGSWFRQEKA